jgi:hypothetical protein
LTCRCGALNANLPGDQNARRSSESRARTVCDDRNLPHSLAYPDDEPVFIRGKVVAVKHWRSSADTFPQLNDYNLAHEHVQYLRSDT